MLSSILYIVLLFTPFLLSNLPRTLAHPQHALIPLVLLHQVSAAGQADLIKRNDYWLPDNVVPVNYNISLLVNMGELSTEGRVKIRVEVKNATDRVTLHVMKQRGILTVMQDAVEVYDFSSHHNAKKIPIKEQKHDQTRGWVKMPCFYLSAEILKTTYVFQVFSITFITTLKVIFTPLHKGCSTQ